MKGLTLFVASVLLLGACGPAAAPIPAAAAFAAAPAGGRTAAAQQLAADWKAGTLKLSDAIDHAVDMLDSAANGTPFRSTENVTRSADATAFAGAVLDACTLLDGQLPKDDNSQVFWMRLGRLAFRAAEEAHAAGRLAEAASLVSAGPMRWQGEGYWYMYPDHDALAAVILAKSGRRSEAIARLQSRVELKGPAEEVYQMLMQGK